MLAARVTCSPANSYTHSQFKIAVAVPPSNDVDVFANDVGFIAIVDEKGGLAGFNVTAGGGMGVTHGNKKTYPRTADVLGFCTVEQGKDVAEKIMLVQRDNGNRVEYASKSTGHLEMLITISAVARTPG